MNEVRFKKSISLFLSLLSVLCVVIISTTLYKTGLISGIDSKIDTLRESVDQETKRNGVIEGMFVDRNGNEITKATEPGVAAHANYAECFSCLIGYNSKRVGLSGLRKTLESDLFNGGKDGIGATVQLTIDANIQNKMYGLLDGCVGSISIVNAKTGQIVALASRGDPKIGYDINKFDKVYSNDEEGVVYYSDLYASIKEFYFNRAVLAQDPPGSCAKVMTAVSLVENDKEDFTYFDNGKHIGGIHNYNYKVYDECDLEKALNYSVNTYFADAGINLGGSKLRKTFENFMVGVPVELDFTTLKSTFLVDSSYTDFLIASNAYGQGELIMSPLHVAMMIGAVMNDGKMMKPYLIESIVNDGKTCHEGKPELLSTATDKKSSRKVVELLESNAKHYGLYKHFDKDDVKIIAKTGTAQVGYSKGTNHLYYSFAVCIGEEIYGICVDKMTTSETSSSMKDTVIKIVETLLSET